MGWGWEAEPTNPHVSLYLGLHMRYGHSVELEPEDSTRQLEDYLSLVIHQGKDGPQRTHIQLFD